MAKANVLLTSHIFGHAAAKMYPDMTQSLYLTVWFKKKKEKKRREGDKKKRRNKLMQRHEEEGKKDASRALQKYKVTFPPSPLFATAPKYKSQGSKGMGSMMNA